MNESKISAILGALVIIIVGLMVVNYFRNLKPGDTTLPGTSAEQTTPPSQVKHTVGKGDSLWSIAEKYYQDGYKWTEIKAANNLSDSDKLTEGQELVIPQIGGQTIAVASPISSSSAKPTTTPVIATVTPSSTIKATATPMATIRPTASPSTTPRSTIAEPTKPTTTDQISGTSYTVVKGDSLWEIAEKAYGDGYQWVKIAEANKLVNPNIIHTGNVFTLPR